MWDTDYVEIPDDTPEDKYEEVARKQFLEDVQKTNEARATTNTDPFIVAFCGLYCVNTDEFPDNEDDL